MARVRDEEVYDAAIATIQQEGYAGATTKKIAQAAGIHEVTLFRRFQSKAELLARVMQHESASFGGPKGVRSTGNLKGDLIRVLTAYANLLQRRGPILPILLAELPRHPELAELLEYPRSILGNVATMIRGYQKRGELIEEDPMLSVSVLVGPLILPKLLGGQGPLALNEEINLEELVTNFLRGRAMSPSPEC